MDKTDIKSLNFDELTEYVSSLGLPAFRAAQLYDWMHVKLADGYDKMTNLPVKLREQLGAETDYTSLKIVSKQVSAIDKTAKYLFECL